MEDKIKELTDRLLFIRHCIFHSNNLVYDIKITQTLLTIPKIKYKI